MKLLPDTSGIVGEQEPSYPSLAESLGPINQIPGAKEKGTPPFLGTSFQV